jgi:galactokinase
MGGMRSSELSASSIGKLVASQFREMFGKEMRIFRAPGRVNLIGEHTDYNDGFVMPAAIGFYTWIAAAKREDRVLEAYSDRFDEKISLSLDTLSGPPRGHWSDFIRGVAAALQHAGLSLSGANLLIHGEVPLGAGLSSSASLEVATALALTSMSGVALPRLELAKLCQRAEHEYAGTRCGIMDQFAVSFGAAGHALKLDCRSLEYQLLPIPQELSVIVCNSMVRHELASGEYNRRRADCEAGVKLLQRYLPEVRALRDVRLSDLEKYKPLFPERVYRRCRHVVAENQRVIAAAGALQSHDAKRFGHLMYLSQASLRDDYEVSCKELDLLVELASSSSGVYGARMTGGGFGGCTVNLVRADCAASFQSHISKAYAEKTGKEPAIFFCEPVQGADEWVSEGRGSS